MSAVQKPTPRLVAPLTGVAAAAGAAVVARLAFGPGTLGYDALWALRWGEEMAHGDAPHFAGAFAPTPHPLANVVSAILSLLGPDAATTALLLLSWIALGALAVGVAHLGAALFSWPVGILAAVVVLTRAQLAAETGQALVDVPFLALVVTACAIEVRRPRSGVIVPTLLVLGGLLRPEGWALELVYLFYRWRALDAPGRARLAALLAVAPALWALMDLWATGDPLFSLHGTQALSDALERPTGAKSALSGAPAALRDIVRTPLLWVGLAGTAAGLLFRPREVRIPGTVFVVGLAGFVLLGVVGLPVLDRYLLLPATMLMLFGAMAALGWTALRDDDRWRRLWQVGGALAIVVIGAGAGGDARALRAAADLVGQRQEIQDDLRAVARGIAGRGCGRVLAPDPRSRAIVRVQLGRPGSGPGTVSFVHRDLLADAGFEVAPNALEALPAGSRPLHTGRFWRAGVEGC